MQQPQDILWEERYRPQTLEDLILPSKFKKQFASGELRNYLFSGQQGTGKTSLARILCVGRKYKFVDCSVDRGISVIRDQISEFASIASIDGVGAKVVILDEIDALKPDTQQALRGTIEKFSKVCRFLATCNYPEKLLPPVVSRLAHINFDLVDNADKTEQVSNYAKRMQKIANENGMTFEDNTAVATIIKKFYPDMRTLLQTLQDFHERGVKLITNSDILSASNSTYTELYEFLISESNSVELYKKLSSWKTKEHLLVNALQTEFCQYLITKRPEYAQKLGSIAVTSHKYGIEIKQCIDPFITMLAMCHEISTTLK